MDVPTPPAYQRMTAVIAHAATESCRESWRTRGNAGPGGRRKNGRTAWQRIIGRLTSGGTGAPPDLTLRFDIAQHEKETVSLWPHARRKKKRRPNAGGRGEKHKMWTRLRLPLG